MLIYQDLSWIHPRHENVDKKVCPYALVFKDYHIPYIKKPHKMPKLMWDYWTSTLHVSSLKCINKPIWKYTDMKVQFPRTLKRIHTFLTFYKFAQQYIIQSWFSIQTLIFTKESTIQNMKVHDNNKTT